MLWHYDNALHLVSCTVYIYWF